MADQYRTRTGRILTDEDLDALADEAERGYDPKNFRRVRGCPMGREGMLREVFRVERPFPDALRNVFYTITIEDIRKTLIHTTVGTINVSEVIGRPVAPKDMGRRIIRVNHTWIIESEDDFTARLRGAQG